MDAPASLPLCPLHTCRAAIKEELSLEKERGRAGEGEREGDKEEEREKEPPQSQVSSLACYCHFPVKGDWWSSMSI